MRMMLNQGKVTTKWQKLNTCEKNMINFTLLAHLDRKSLRVGPAPDQKETLSDLLTGLRSHSFGGESI